MARTVEDRVKKAGRDIGSDINSFQNQKPSKLGEIKRAAETVATVMAASA